MKRFKLWIAMMCAIPTTFSATHVTAQESHDHEVTVDATAPYDDNNVFAKILRKELPAKVVYEDEFALAFHTIAPKVKKHILVIPKGPYTNFMNFTQNATIEEQVGLLKAINKVAAQMGVSESGFRLNTNTGNHGGQTVPHLHFHILGGEPVPGIGK